MNIYQKSLFSIVVLTAVGCSNNSEPKDKNSYTAIELLSSAQKQIINSTPKRVVFKNEQIRTYSNFSVACGEYGIKQNFFDNNPTYSRYIILKEGELLIEKKRDEQPFSKTWNSYCQG